jgi:hypothetical protein
MSLLLKLTAQWLIQVPPRSTFRNSTFCLLSVFMCFVWISEQTAIISVDTIEWFVLITQAECVDCAIRMESSYKIYVKLKDQNQCLYINDGYKKQVGIFIRFCCVYLGGACWSSPFGSLMQIGRRATQYWCGDFVLYSYKNVQALPFGHRHFLTNFNTFFKLTKYPYHTIWLTFSI